MVDIECLELIDDRYGLSETIGHASLIIFLKRLGAEKKLIKQMMERYGGGFDNEDLNQIERLNNLIDSYRFAIHSDHKMILFLYLSISQNFEIDKEMYKRYIDSVAKLESNADLNERIMNILENIFSSYHDEENEFIEAVVGRSFDPVDFWSQLCEKYSDDPELIFFAVRVLSEVDEKYRDVDTLAAIEFFHMSEYDITPSQARGLLDIKQDNKLWLNDKNNRSWFNDGRMRERFGDLGEVSFEFQAAFVGMFADYPHMPARLNQLAAFDVVLSVIGSSHSFGNQGVQLIRVLLVLPDRLYDLTLDWLEKLKESALLMQNTPAVFKQLVEQSLWFLRPFTIHGLSCSFEKSNAFFNKLSETQFRGLIGAHDQPVTLLLVITSCGVCLKSYNSGVSNLYWRFLELIFEMGDQLELAFAKHDEFLMLGEQNGWFRDRGTVEKTFWNPGMPTAKYIRVELTRLVDEVLALSVSTAQKREHDDEEDINPRPTKRPK